MLDALGNMKRNFQLVYCEIKNCQSCQKPFEQLNKLNLDCMGLQDSLR